MIDIKWEKRFAVGYEKIDDEHRVFIDLIRSSSEAIDGQKSPEHVTRFLDELVLYAKFHFFSEETLMICSNYPKYEEHKQDHIRLFETLVQQIEEYKENPKDGESLVLFIFEWFVIHTMQVDKELSDYLIESGG